MKVTRIHSAALLAALFLPLFVGAALSGQVSKQQPSAQKENHNAESCCVVSIPSKPTTNSAPEPDAKSLISWNSDIQKASAEALKSNKPMLLEFWAGWCAVCRETDKEIFSDPKVAEAINRKFIPVRVNFDEKLALDRKYHIANLPTVSLTDSYGGELYRTFGSMDRSAFSKTLNDFPGNVSRVNAFERSLVANRTDLKSLYGLADEARHERFYLLSNASYERALKLESDPKKKEEVLAAEGSNYLELKDPQTSIDTFQKCLKQSPSGTGKPLCMVGLGQAYAAAGEGENARKTLGSVVQQYPATESAEKAKQTLAQLR